MFSLSSSGKEAPRKRNSRGFFRVSILGGGEDGGDDTGCGSSLFGLDAAVDDEGMGLKKLKIDPFLTGLLPGAVGSAVFLVSSATIFGKEGDPASISVFLGTDVSVEAASGEVRRFFGFVSRGESSRVLRLPYVRSGLARDRDVDGAGLADLFKSVPFISGRRAISTYIFTCTRLHKFPCLV